MTPVQIAPVGIQKGGIDRVALTMEALGHGLNFQGIAAQAMEQQHAPGTAGQKEGFTHLYNYPVPDCRFPDGAPGPADP